MFHINSSRRRLMGAAAALPWLPLLPGCSSVPFQPLKNASSTPEAVALLQVSATAHGWGAFNQIEDLSLRYAGEWRAFINGLQPVLADSGFRGGSEERLLLRKGLVAQAHTGPSGTKQVLRQVLPKGPDKLRVWFNGQESAAVGLGADQLAAAALVVDGYSLFLLGPLLLAGRWAQERSLVMELAEPERVNEHDCEVLRVRMSPGFGLSPTEQLALYIDRKEHLMRRVRFTLDGLASTVGAVAEVETFDHVTLHGVRWPTRFYERLLRPLALPVHDWRLTGLDVNRSLSMADVSGANFTGRAVAPAAALQAAPKPQ
jgi:hypothetical protein